MTTTNDVPFWPEVGYPTSKFLFVAKNLQDYCQECGWTATAFGEQHVCTAKHHDDGTFIYITSEPTKCLHSTPNANYMEHTTLGTGVLWMCRTCKNIYRYEKHIQQWIWFGVRQCDGSIDTVWRN